MTATPVTSSTATIHGSGSVQSIETRFDTGAARTGATATGNPNGEAARAVTSYASDVFAATEPPRRAIWVPSWTRADIARARPQPQQDPTTHGIGRQDSERAAVGAAEGVVPLHPDPT